MAMAIAMTSSQHYQALQVDEKDEYQSTSPPKTPKTRKWSKTRIALAFSLLFLASLAIVAATAQAFKQNQHSQVSDPPFDDEAAEMLREHLARTSGSTYLLGVGKADITG